MELEKDLQTRRDLVEKINGSPRDRGALEEEYGEVWTTQELQERFVVDGFLAPFVAVTEKATGTQGSLMFQHSPRYYFGYEPAKVIPEELTAFTLTAVNSRGEVEDILKR